MRQTFRLLSLCTSLLLACGGDDDTDDTPTPDPTTLTGTFTVEGNTYACEVTTQLFEATGEYSVLCQNDSAGLVQVTFKDEVSARRAQAFTIAKRNYVEHADPDVIDVSYFELGIGINADSKDDFDGEAVVAAEGSHHALMLTGVMLEDTDEINTLVVSAEIEF